MVNSFEPAAKKSATRNALGVVIANVDADTVAHLAVACKVLQDDARCVPSLVFGPESKVWYAPKDTPPDVLGVPGHADAIVTAVVTRHRPGRLKRLVLCPPPEQHGLVFTAPWSRGFWVDSDGKYVEREKNEEKEPSMRKLLPATVTFCADASSSLEGIWAEPSSTRLNQSARTAAARGVIPVDKDDVQILVARGVNQVTLVPRAVGKAGLFTTNLTRLAVGGAASATDDDVRAFLKTCTHLRALDICEASDSLTGQCWWSKDEPGTPAHVPELETLHVARCETLGVITLFAPKLADLAVTECPKFQSIKIDGGDGLDGQLPAMRHAVLGDFRPTEDYRHMNWKGRRFTLPATEALGFIKRCPFLETVSVPAGPPEPRDSASQLSFVTAWADTLRDRSQTLTRLCIQRPLTIEALKQLLASVAPSLPRLAELYFAVSLFWCPYPEHHGTVATEANAVADSLVQITDLCPSLVKLTMVDHPADWTPETPQSLLSNVTRASLELMRGSLLARNRVTRDGLAFDVTNDFHGEASATWLGTAETRERRGLHAITEAMDDDVNTRNKERRRNERE